jgi:hypothetical protein
MVPSRLPEKERDLFEQLAAVSHFDPRKGGDHGRHSSR